MIPSTNESTGVTAQSAYPVSIATSIYAESHGFQILKTATDRYILTPLNQVLMTIEADTLIELLVAAEDERVYGVLDLQDTEAELLFGQAFLRSHREFLAWQLLTKQ